MDKILTAVTMVGLLVIAKDISPDLARETIKRVKVRGIIKTSSKVKAVLRELGIKVDNIKN